MTQPTKHQIKVWTEVMYRRLPASQAMRSLRIKNRATYDNRMNTITKYVLRKHPPIV